MKKDAIPRTLFIASMLFLVFLGGFAASHFKLFPFLTRALNEGTRRFQQRTAKPQIHAARHDFSGVKAYDEKGPTTPVAKPGEYILLTSYWPDSKGKAGLRLIDKTGRVVHEWVVPDAKDLWPDRPALKDAVAGFTEVHGSHLFENGDVIFNVEYLGLIRMDATGKVIWKVDRRTHHSVHRADDGNFWACEMRMIDSQEEIARRFPGLSAPLVEDLVLEVTPEGAIVREISILELLYQSEHKSRLLTQGRNWELLHLNDVEPLPKSLAAQYPKFQAGDLMVSVRNLSLVLVFDPATKKIKWSQDGAFLRQHDPDFIGDGWISVYDNNSDATPDSLGLGGSRLIAIKPDTSERRNLYPADKTVGGHERPFFSFIGGKSQQLPDGHWLITEATAGRVFEIDAHGRTCWEWGQAPEGDPKMVSEVLEGTRYDFDPAAVRKWAKSPGPSDR